MKHFKNIDTNEIWSEDEIRTEYNNFREESDYMKQFDSFEEYLEDQIRLGKNGESGLSPIWYAVQKDREDAWDYGSFDLEEAKGMLKEQGYGLIAVIDENSNYCEDEIAYENI